LEIVHGKEGWTDGWSGRESIDLVQTTAHKLKTIRETRVPLQSFQRERAESNNPPPPPPPRQTFSLSVSNPDFIPIFPYTWTGSEEIHKRVKRNDNLTFHPYSIRSLTRDQTLKSLLQDLTTNPREKKTIFQLDRNNRESMSGREPAGYSVYLI